MNNQAFAVLAPIEFDGPQSRNPLAFNHYNPDELIDGKTMRDHIRLSVSY